ncbi:MAG TPA: hypothetical protein VMV92_00485 [Streptosporangiaceae bacterium]|nr:hypothetical protein [Streptosporangiaceae bacterium]
MAPRIGHHYLALKEARRRLHEPRNGEIRRRACRNSYRVKRPVDVGIRHHGPPTIRLVNLGPSQR